MKPEEIFRFVNVRPVQQASDERVTKGFATYGKDAHSPFHRQIESLKGEGIREQAIELARKRLATNEQNQKELFTLLEAVRAAAGKGKVAEAKKVVETMLGQPPAMYIKSERAHKLKDAIWDRLYAHTLAPEEQPEERELVYDGVRAFHFLELLSNHHDNETPFSWIELSAVMPTIPKGLIPESPVIDRSWEDRYSKEVVGELGSVHDKLVSINAAIEDLQNSDRVYKATELRSVLDLSAVETRIQELRTVRLSGPAVELPRATVGEVSENLGGAGAATAPSMVEQKVIMVPKKAPWLFEEFGTKNLNKTTIEILSARKNRLFELETTETVAALEQEKHELVAGFLKELPLEALPYVRHNTQFASILKDVAIADYQIAPMMPAIPTPAPGSASARGIQPLGMGDLLVVKQELINYAAGEVAHIENVLKSEFKTRMHSRTREVEEIVITETEQLEESEKDLQTTERFELQKEAQKTIQDQMSIQAGVSITAGYGPVSVTAHADFALSQSSTESNRNASTFAKQITERSVSRIMRRTREERMRRTLERFEEKNEHGFDNKAGTGHVIGIYRWVDKYYKARLINYGRRLMLEFIVPEPAAFYLHLQSNQTLKGITMEKPREPMVSGRLLKPTDLYKWNYTDFVAQYNVQDIEPYPAEVIKVSAAFAEGAGSKENMDYAKTSEKLTIPKGYMCYDVFGEIGWQGYAQYFFECFIAGQRWGSVTANGVEGIVPISVKGWVSAFHVNVVAICELTQEAKKAWQLKAYSAIMNAYERALADYNEQVASAQIQAGVQIQGRNPEINRKIEHDELKKGVLRLLTNNFAQTRISGAWRFGEMFNSMQSNGQFGYPEFDIDEALVEGRIIQFFEQAFEWNNTTYRFYPYSWGRKGGWKDTFPQSDTDPQFTDFLRAGSARVVVPAHPSYTETVLHYMATNEIWNGGNPPTLYDPLYISIVNELKSDADGDLDAELPACKLDSVYPCLADEWEVKLPTTLVYLQEDAKLPDFTT